MISQSFRNAAQSSVYKGQRSREREKEVFIHPPPPPNVPSNRIRRRPEYFSDWHTAQLRSVSLLSMFQYVSIKVPENHMKLLAVFRSQQKIMMKASKIF
jgi:hypothetical protein